MKYIILSVTILFLLITQGSAEVYSGSGYKIDCKNWFLTKYPSYDVMLLAPTNSIGTYHENISIVVTKYPYKSVSDWESIKAYQVQSLKQIIKEFKLEGWDPVNIGGKEGRKISYTGKYMNFNLRWIQLNTLKDGTWYTISFISDDRDFDKYRREAMKIIGSFRFK